MAGVVESSSVTMDFSKATGNVSGWYLGLIAGQGVFPNFIVKGERVLNYTVPANKKLTVQSVMVSMQSPYKTTAAALGAVPVGKIELLIDGVVAAEWFDQDTGTVVGGNANCNYEGYQLGRWPLSLGQGIDLTVGQVLSVRITPSAADPMRVNTTIFGVNGSTPVVENAFYISDSSTSLQTVLSYTVPSGGLSLKTISCEGSRYELPLLGFVEVNFSGRLVAEFPLQTYAEKPVGGFITIPLYGLEAYPGNQISVEVSDASRVGVKYIASIVGDLTDLSTGGGASVVWGAIA